jgi:hypothetical protein
VEPAPEISAENAITAWHVARQNATARSSRLEPVGFLFIVETLDMLCAVRDDAFRNVMTRPFGRALKVTVSDLRMCGRFSQCH